MAEVRTEAELKTAIANSEAEIVVMNDISMTSPTTIGYTVNMRGESGASIFWGSPSAARPDMFILSATGNLTIESLTFDAQGRDGTLVQINGGAFTMNQGTVLKSLRGSTANNAVSIGAVASAVGGSFTMNYGLITDVDSSDAVFCSGGTVIMDNDAAIADNMAAGIVMMQPAGGIRPSLTMKKNTRIANNQSKQAGGGGGLLESDITMGVDPGDAPIVTGNQCPSYGAGFLLSSGSVLTMRYGAQISNNHAATFAGGVLASRSTVAMHDNASIQDNTCDTEACGVMLAANSAMTMDGNTQVFGNISNGRGGGIYLQSGASLEMSENASVHDNQAVNGAGIYLIDATVSIGVNDASNKIYGNTATEKGGGVFIAAGSTLNLSGQTEISQNTAPQGKGIYKEGALNVSQSPKVLDGLFFDDLTDTFAAMPTYQLLPDVTALITENDPIVFQEIPDAMQGQPIPEPPGRFYAKGGMDTQGQSDNVPTIVDTLTADAKIQLESSPHVSVNNIPLQIAEKDVNYAQLVETDRTAWLIPPEFIPGHSVVFNAALDEVWIDMDTYTITYLDLFGVSHANPVSYVATDLPITLQAPNQRLGYTFVGWYNAQGQLVTQIPAGTTGNVALTAVWKEMTLSYRENGSCVIDMPQSIAVRQGQSIIIPCVIPRRSGYTFLCWCTSPTGEGVIYYPGNTIQTTNGDITLYARWQPCSLCDCHSFCLRRACALFTEE